MEDTLIFVDDGFFGLVKNYFQKEDGKPKKYLQTFRNICKKENFNLRHLYVYTAPPYQSPKPTQKEDFLMSRYQNMTKMLREKKWITLREGRCQKIINKYGNEEFSQKGIDALIVLDMYDFKENYPSVKKIILIASDSDFVPVIERMKQKGIEVIIYTYFDRKRHSKFSTSNHLLNVASKWVKLTKKDFEDSESIKKQENLRTKEANK
ncbi:NYN domain-containing protein [Candidatus Pacearchaeota archaeon]|nr:NYN domain-containing protein [Candidatus Pacearchaeota archaeon]